jgi:hypothetical protein
LESSVRPWVRAMHLLWPWRRPQRSSSSLSQCSKLVQSIIDSTIQWGCLRTVNPLTISQFLVGVRARVKARRVLAERLQKPFKLPRIALVRAYSTITTTDNTSSTIPDDDSTYPMWEDDISITHQSWAQPCQLQPDILTFVLHDFPDTTQDYRVKSTFLVEDITR